MQITEVEKSLREIQKLAYEKVSGEHCSSDADWNIILIRVGAIIELFNTERVDVYKYKNLESRIIALENKDMQLNTKSL